MLKTLWFLQLTLCLVNNFMGEKITSGAWEIDIRFFSMPGVTLRGLGAFVFGWWSWELLGKLFVINSGESTLSLDHQLFCTFQNCLQSVCYYVFFVLLVKSSTISLWVNLWFELLRICIKHSSVLNHSTLTYNLQCQNIYRGLLCSLFVKFYIMCTDQKPLSFIHLDYFLQ